MKIKYDFHIHSCLSPCASDDMTPENIAGMAYINHLDAIALTDHNSCKNCEAFLAAVQKYHIYGICGMELTTAEEIHVLCLFPDLDDAMHFDEYVSKHLFPIPNKPQIFGNQLLYAPQDTAAGVWDPLLLSTTDIDFFSLPDLVASYHGIHIPAHIERSSNSISASFGLVPSDSRFQFYEVNDPDRKEEMLSLNPVLHDRYCITDSDAHYLYNIKDGENSAPLDVDALSFESIFHIKKRP